MLTGSSVQSDQEGSGYCPPHVSQRLTYDGDSRAPGEGNGMKIWSNDPVPADSAARVVASQDVQQPPAVLLALSAALLLTMGGIHLHFVVQSASVVIGFSFFVDTLGGLVLAIAMLVAPRRQLPIASLLSLMFMVGTLLALVLSLTVGLFGIRERIDGMLVVPTLVVGSIGTIVLTITTVLAFRMRSEV